MKLIWQSPNSPRGLRKKLGYDDAEFLLCGDTLLIIEYAAYGQIRLVFAHKESVPPWCIILPVLDTYFYETAMQVVAFFDDATKSLRDDAGLGHATITWQMVAAMYGWDRQSPRLRLDNDPSERNGWTS